MSEWKWCLICDHRYTAHENLNGSDARGRYQGACTLEGCKCEAGDYDLSDLF